MADKSTNIYLICGDEEFLKLEKKNRLLRLYGAEESINFNEFSGRDQDISELRDLADTLPFMQEHRVILLSDTGLFKGASDERFEEFLRELNSTTVLIFFESETDAANKLFKLVKEKGEVSKFIKTDSMSYKEAEAEQLKIGERVKKYLKEEGREISGKNLNNLLMLTGYDLFNIHNELEKLICYTEGRESSDREIKEEDIEAVCSKTVSDRVFDMLSAKLSGNTKKAFKLYEEMLSVRTAPMKILFMLERQFNQVYILKELLSSGISEGEAAKKMEIQPWLLRKLRDQSRNLRKADARRYLERSIELEEKVKTGDIEDRIAVELLLIE
ncbi:MAG: DNA polymerase III subunit delta [Candidatus Avilachnospira sp.]|jgi:DNA polymerase-3 subunit delta